MANKRTKKSRILSIIFGILHLLCLIGPFCYFLPVAFITGAMVSKITLGFTMVTSMILAAISFIVDVKHRAGLHRSCVWLLIVGILFCLSSIKPFIWIMAGATLLDELVFVNLHDHYSKVAAMNKEIDIAMGN